MKVCVVGDLHVAPGQDLTRLDWIAAHIEATQPDAVVLIGDLCNWDSVSTHDPIGSVNARYAPTIAEDFAITHEALERLDGIPGELYFTAGNHEDRLARYEGSDARLQGTLWPRLKAMYAAYGWDWTNYGERLNLGGVRFTHCALDARRKPYGNWNVLARDLTFDLVFGHTHKSQQMTFPKIDGGVSILNVGCALPQNHVEEYAKLTPTSWWYGVVDVTIRDGRLADYSRFSMSELETRFGALASAS